MMNKMEKSPKFTEEIMKQAVLEVTKEGVSMYRTAAKFGLCKKTLKNYIDSYLSAPDAEKDTFRFWPDYELNQVFNHHLEDLFVKHLIRLYENEEWQTAESLRRAAYDFAVQCEVIVPESWNKKKMAGYNWMYSFRDRHPIVNQILKRKTKFPLPSNHKSDVDMVQNAVELSNVKILASSCNESAEELIIEEFEDSVANETIEVKEEDCSDSEYEIELVEEIDIPSDSESNHISSEKFEAKKSTKEYFRKYLKLDSNYDGGENIETLKMKSILDEFEENITETYEKIARNNVVPANRVYSLDEIALIAQNTRGVERPEVVVTACCCADATGQSLPPFMIFSGCKFEKNMLIGALPGVCGVVTPSGRIEDDVFVDVLQHFADFSKPSTENPVILIVDDNDCHITIGSIEFCHRHGIELVTIPSVYSKFLQPLEKSIFWKLKAYFNRAYMSYRSENPATTISVCDVSFFFFTIYPLVLSEENIMVGFRNSGLYPLDEDMVKDAVSEKKSVDELPKLEHDIKFLHLHLDENNAKAASLEVPEIEDKWDQKFWQHFYREKSPFDEFVQNLEEAYNELHMYGGVDANNVYNMDEIEILVHNPAGSKRPNATISLMLCCFVNAAGQTVPPYGMFGGTEFEESMLKGGIDGMRGMAFESHSAEERSLMLLQHFQQFAKATLENRVLLLMDTDYDHINVSCLDYCKEHGIALITTPPIILQSMHPLEKIFRIMRPKFEEEYKKFLSELGKKSGTKYDLMKIVTKLFREVFTSENIVRGFQLAGVWPLNKTKFGARTVKSASTVAETKDKELSDEYDLKSEEDYVEELMVDCDFPPEEMITESNNFDILGDLDAAFEQLYESGGLYPDRVYVLGEFKINIPFSKSFRVETNLKTVCCYASATGHTIPPFLVLKAPFDQEFMQIGPEGAVAFVADDDGLVDDSIIVKILSHFCEHVGCGEDRQVLLITDDVEMHESDLSLRFCNRNGIILHSLPKKRANTMHPLHKTVFKTMLSRLLHGCEIMKMAKKRLMLSDEDLFRVFSNVYDEEFVSEKIVNAFQKCSMWNQWITFEEKKFGGAWKARRRIPELLSDSDNEVPNSGYESPAKMGKRKKLTCECRYCDEVCSSLEGRNEHEKIHVKNGKHCCPVCNHLFGSKSALIQHRKKHILRIRTVEKKYEDALSS